MADKNMEQFKKLFESENIRTEIRYVYSKTYGQKLTKQNDNVKQADVI